MATGMASTAATSALFLLRSQKCGANNGSRAIESSIRTKGTPDQIGSSSCPALSAAAATDGEPSIPTNAARHHRHFIKGSPVRRSFCLLFVEFGHGQQRLYLAFDRWRLGNCLAKGWELL